MIVTVRLFARAKDLAGSDVVRLELPDWGTVAELRRLLSNQRPALAELLKNSAIAVAGDFALDTISIPVGADVAVLPPVSGG